MTWQKIGDFEDIIYEKQKGVAKVTINRPEKRNAFRPKTVSEMYQAFLDAREDSSIGVVLLTGAGPHTDGKYAFCSGGIRVCVEMLGMWGKTEFPGSMFSIYKS